MLRVLLFDDYLGRLESAEILAELLGAQRVLDARDGALLYEKPGSGVVSAPPARLMPPNLPIELHVCSGQVRGDRGVANSEALVRDVVRRGWPFDDGDRWALAVVDLVFEVDRAVSYDRGHGFGSTIFGILEEVAPELRAVAFTDVELKAAEAQLVGSRRRAFFQCIPKSRDTAAATALQEAARVNGLFPDLGGVLKGRSLAWLQTLRSARIRSRQRSSLLIGPTGSGKEGLADYVHYWSGRPGPKRRTDLGARGSDAQLVALFGMEANAIPNARARESIFELAHRGTAFLDEIQNCEPDVQGTLLTVLEQRSDGRYYVVRTGGTQEREVDVMTLAATNLSQDELQRRIRSGAFREDLYQRLSGDQAIVIPPLVDRLDDLPELVEHFARLAEQELGGVPREITLGAIARLREHVRSGGPGSASVRGLRNIIREAVHERPGLGVLDEFHLDLSDPAVSEETNGAQSASPAAAPPAPRSGTSAGLAATMFDPLDGFDPGSVPVRELRGVLGHGRHSWARFTAALFTYLWDIHGEKAKVVRELAGVLELDGTDVTDQLLEWGKLWEKEDIPIREEIRLLIQRGRETRQGRKKR
jgi:MoxR-like ATPase